MTCAGPDDCVDPFCEGLHRRDLLEELRGLLRRRAARYATDEDARTDARRLLLAVAVRAGLEPRVCLDEMGWADANPTKAALAVLAAQVEALHEDAAEWAAVNGRVRQDMGWEDHRARLDRARKRPKPVVTGPDGRPIKGDEMMDVPLVIEPW